MHVNVFYMNSFKWNINHFVHKELSRRRPWKTVCSKLPKTNIISNLLKQYWHSYGLLLGDLLLPFFTCAFPSDLGTFSSNLLPGVVGLCCCFIAASMGLNWNLLSCCIFSRKLVVSLLPDAFAPLPFESVELVPT